MTEFWIVYNAWSGNPSASRDQDWISEAAVAEEVAPVAESLRKAGYSVVVYPLSSIADMIIRWEGPGRPDLVFNLAEGYRGDAHKEMNVAALFEMLEVPFTGNGARTLAFSPDKILTKKLLALEGLPTPSWTFYDGKNEPDLSRLSFPLIAKPSRQDASIGIGSDAVFNDSAGLAEGVRRLYEKYREPILIESYIEGREFNAAVLEEEGVLRVLPLSEIRFDGVAKDKPKITSYEAKWLIDHPLYRLTPAVCPADIPPLTEEKLVSAAERTFRLLEGKDYGRVDFRLDAEGKPYILEYNPNPDISLSGGFVRSLLASGRSYDDFVKLLVKNNLRADSGGKK